MYTVRVSHATNAPTAAPLEATTGVAVVTFTVQPRSSRKTLDFVDLKISDSPGATIRRDNVPEGLSGSVRLAKALAPKDKKHKHRGEQTLALSVGLTGAVVSSGALFKAAVAYQVNGAAAPVAAAVPFALRAGSLLVASAIDVVRQRHIHNAPRWQV